MPRAQPTAPKWHLVNRFLLSAGIVPASFFPSTSQAQSKTPGEQRSPSGQLRQTSEPLPPCQHRVPKPAQPSPALTWADVKLCLQVETDPPGRRTFHLLHAPQGVLQGRQRAGFPLGLLVCGEVDLQLLERPDQLLVRVGFGGLFTAMEAEKEGVRPPPPGHFLKRRTSGPVSPLGPGHLGPQAPCGALQGGQWHPWPRPGEQRHKWSCVNMDSERPWPRNCLCSQPQTSGTRGALLTKMTSERVVQLPDWKSQQCFKVAPPRHLVRERTPPSLC